METPFDSHIYIEAPASDVQRSMSRLLLCPQEHQLLYMVLSLENKILDCRVLHNDRSLNGESFLRMALEKEPKLQFPYRECQVMSHTSSFTLVPRIYADTRRLEMARTLLEQEADEEGLYHMDIEELPASALFMVPHATRHLLSSYLGNFSMSHISGNCVRLTFMLSRFTPTLLLLLIQDQTVFLSAAKAGKFHLCNAYPYRSVKDIVYYIQAARSVLDLTDTDTPIYTTGDFEYPGALFLELKEWLPEVQVPAFLERYAEYLGAEAPFWKYAHLAV